MVNNYNDIKLQTFYGQIYRVLEVNEPLVELKFTDTGGIEVEELWGILNTTPDIDENDEHYLKTYAIVGMQVFFQRHKTNVFTQVDINIVPYNQVGIVSYKEGTGGMTKIKKGFGRKYLQLDEMLEFPQLSKYPILMSFYDEPVVNPWLRFLHTIACTGTIYLWFQPTILTLDLMPQDMIIT